MKSLKSSTGIESKWNTDGTDWNGLLFKKSVLIRLIRQIRVQ